MAEIQSDVDGSGRWPFRSWQFYCGLHAGAGIGLLIGAALVEMELLSTHSKAWVSVVGIVVFAAGAFVPIIAGSGKRSRSGEWQ